VSKISKAISHYTVIKTMKSTCLAFVKHACHVEGKIDDVTIL